MKKKSSCSEKRAKAYVQGRQRKKPVHIYVSEKKRRREGERKNVHKHDRCGG
jgi:hypothetical protein